MEVHLLCCRPVDCVVARDNPQQPIRISNCQNRTENSSSAAGSRLSEDLHAELQSQIAVCVWGHCQRSFCRRAKVHQLLNSFDPCSPSGSLKATSVNWKLFCFRAQSRIMDQPAIINLALTTPLQLAIAICLLWNLLGIATLAGLICSVVLVPFHIFASYKLKKSQVGLFL